MNYRATIIFYILLFIASVNTKADEGMWLPYLMSNSQIETMQKIGLTIPFDSIYNPNKPSLKDAVVSLDDGSCTAEFISSKGLLLTNHHCGYDDIQNHSSVEHDYLKDGFWAKNLDEELPNPGKTATILVDAKDFTSRFLAMFNNSITEMRRGELTDSLTEVIEDSVAMATGMEASVESFFSGNMYLLFITQTYKDVRLVGTPPSDIGKFGGDTDNWVWPRHTGDFSIFRVYCAPDGSPAEYSKNNIPFTPKKHLTISLEGINEGDFTMVMGYPGSTDRYMTSYGITQVEEYVNPVIAGVRGIKQDIWKKEMEKNPKVAIQYASKYSESSNYWKYSIGQNEGLKHQNVIEERVELENQFSEWIEEDSIRFRRYEKTLPILQATYTLSNDMTKSITTAEETVLAGPDLPLFVLNMSYAVYELEDLDSNTPEYADALKSIKEDAAKFYKDFDQPLDEEVFLAMLKYYLNDVDEDQRAKSSDIFPKKFKGDYTKFTAGLYSKTLFNSPENLSNFLNSGKLESIDDDPFFQFIKIVLGSYFELSSILNQIDSEENRAMRQYTEGLFQMFPNKDFYPDANSTFRLSYGKVGKYDPADGVVYDYKTTLKGVMEKEDPKNPDFLVPVYLKELYNQKEYGRYEDTKGYMPVCFITDNDITGGNSGSPVMDRNGSLIGVAFDGNWEAMTGDLAFEPELQKTICVDIRYVLFVVDKFAGAKNLIEEMTITEAPSDSPQGGV